MSQAMGESPSNPGLFGWFKGLLRKDKHPSPAPGGTTVAATGATTTATAITTAPPATVTTNATTQRTSSRKRVAAEEALQAMSTTGVAARPVSPAASPHQLQPQVPNNLLRTQTWISERQSSQTGGGTKDGGGAAPAGGPCLDAVEDCQDALGRWPDSPRQERSGPRVQPTARHATMLSAPLESPRMRVSETVCDRNKPSGGHTAVEMLDPRSTQRSFVKGVPSACVEPRMGPVLGSRSGNGPTPLDGGDSRQRLQASSKSFPHSADDLGNILGPSATAAATAAVRSVPGGRPASPRETSGSGYEHVRVSMADGRASNGGGSGRPWSPSLRPVPPSVPGHSRSRLSGAAHTGYGSGGMYDSFTSGPAVPITADGGTSSNGPSKATTTTTTTTKSSSKGHSSKTTTGGGDGTVETVRTSCVQEQSSRKEVHQVMIPDEAEDDEADDEGDGKCGQGDGGRKISSAAMRGRTTTSAAANGGAWPEQQQGSSRGLVSGRELERREVSYSRNRQERSEETSLKRSGGEPGNCSGDAIPGGAAVAGPEIITTTRRESRREEQEEFQKIFSSAGRGGMVLEERRRQAFEEEKKETEERREMHARAPGEASGIPPELGSHQSNMSYYSSTRTSMHVKTSSKVTLSTHHTVTGDPADLVAAVAAAAASAASAPVPASRTFMAEDSAYGTSFVDVPSSGAIPLAVLSGRGRVPNYYHFTPAATSSGAPFNLLQSPTQQQPTMAMQAMPPLQTNYVPDGSLTEEDLAKVMRSQASSTGVDSRADILERFLGDAHGSNVGGGGDGDGDGGAASSIRLIAPPMTPGARSTTSAASVTSAAAPVAPIYEANLAAAEAEEAAEAARSRLAAGSRVGDGYSPRPLSRANRRGGGGAADEAGGGGGYSPSWGRGGPSRQQAAAAAQAQDQRQDQHAKTPCSQPSTTTTTTRQQQQQHQSSTVTRQRHPYIGDTVDGSGCMVQHYTEQRQKHQQQTSTTTTTEAIRRTSRGEELLWQQQEQQEREEHEEEHVCDRHHRCHHQEATTSTTTTTTTTNKTSAAMNPALAPPGSTKTISSLKQKSMDTEDFGGMRTAAGPHGTVVHIPTLQEQSSRSRQLPQAVDTTLRVQREAVDEVNYTGEEDEHWDGIGGGGSPGGGGHSKSRHRRHRRVRIASAWRNGGNGGNGGSNFTGSSCGGGCTTDGEDGVRTSWDVNAAGASGGGGGGGGGSSGSRARSLVSRSGKSIPRISPPRGGAHRASSSNQGGFGGLSIAGLNGFGGAGAGWDSTDPDLYGKYDSSSRALAAQAQLMRGTAARSRNTAALIIDTSALNPLTWQSGTSPSSAANTGGGIASTQYTSSPMGAAAYSPSRRHQSSPGNDDILMPDAASGVGGGSHTVANLGIGGGGAPSLRPQLGAMGMGIGAGGVGMGGSLYHRANMGLSAGLAELAAGLAGLGGGGGFGGPTSRRMREPAY